MSERCVREGKRREKEVIFSEIGVDPLQQVVKVEAEQLVID